jgi:hypothetical protein
MGLKPSIFVFNSGKSRTILNWSPIAMAYYVYRSPSIVRATCVSTMNLMRQNVITTTALT